MYRHPLNSPQSRENALRAMRQELDTPDFALIELEQSGEPSLAPVVDPLGISHIQSERIRIAGARRGVD